MKSAFISPESVPISLKPIWAQGKDFFEATWTIIIGNRAFPSPEPSQSWFWTPKWQAMEEEAQSDLKAGRYKDFENPEDLFEDLDS